MNVEIAAEKINVGFVLRLKGDVDMNTSPDIRSRMAEILNQGPAAGKALLVNLSQVRYMDSSGIATLIEALQVCMRNGMRFRLVDLSQPVRDVFELARLATVFEIFPSMTEAATGL